MITVTAQKPIDEIMQSLEQSTTVYIIGCGTCATILHTGGKSEVLEMKSQLETSGKKVTGWMVIPTACDELTRDALKDHSQDIEPADSILVMSCAFGVQTVSLYSDKPVSPALNTLFIGKEQEPGYFAEVCMQCGECVLEDTGGICPVTVCHKGLLNGPCGGTNNGKCEIDKEKDCAWTLVYRRLEKLGRLDRMKKYHPPKNYQAVPRPGTVRIALEGSELQ